MAYCSHCRQDREEKSGCCVVCGQKLAERSHLDDLRPMGCEQAQLDDLCEQQNAQQLEAILQAHVEKERQERKDVPVSVVKRQRSHGVVLIVSALAAVALLVVVVASVLASMQQNQKIEAKLDTFVQCMEQKRLQDAIETFDPLQAQPFLQAIRITFSNLSKPAQAIYAQQFLAQAVDVPLILSSNLRSLTIQDIRILGRQGEHTKVKMVLRYTLQDETFTEKEHVFFMVQRENDWYICRT